MSGSIRTFNAASSTSLLSASPILGDAPDLQSFRIQNWIDDVTAVPGADAKLGPLDFVDDLLRALVGDGEVGAATVATVLLQDPVRLLVVEKC